MVLVESVLKSRQFLLILPRVKVKELAVSSRRRLSVKYVNFLSCLSHKEEQNGKDRNKDDQKDKSRTPALK